ncbi:MAG: 16S rRNA (guanine(527)-N(7))-methyltransferase RsmG [Muribaculaceae bacterium]|nr:16S rRNA (guanine(527)-N(7))-methyltransferase RsmG [Muribaculaceae bacterium]
MLFTVIEKYFGAQLSDSQRAQFDVLATLYPEWNARVNVISRQDIGNLEVNHVLHSLAIARFVPFKPGTEVLDLGTGGGFPGVPLAVLFPETRFHLVDRIAKKLRVAEDIIRQAGIANVTLQHGDIGEVRGRKFDFVVSRAVMDLRDMVPLVKRLISHGGENVVPNGLICLKGGDVSGETQQWRHSAIVDDLATYFSEPFFQTKKLIYLPL